MCGPRSKYDESLIGGAAGRRYVPDRRPAPQQSRAGLGGQGLHGRRGEAWKRVFSLPAGRQDTVGMARAPLHRAVFFAGAVL
eukprot:5097946-Alexandrium_andersonii.AAC.1